MIACIGTFGWIVILFLGFWTIVEAGQAWANHCNTRYRVRQGDK